MMRAGTLIICTMMILLSVVSFSVESIASVSADYAVSVNGSGAHVSIAGALLQGVTNPPAVNSSFKFGSIPAFTFRLEGSNVSSLSSLLNEALRQKTPSASASNIVLNCDSNGTEYHYSLSFDVAGIATNTAGSNVVDLSWRSFLIGQDFKVGNNTINAMLKDYLESRIVSLTQLPASETSPLPRVRRWYWNNQLRRPQEIGPLTSAALMFDFSSLNISLTSWSRPPAVPGSNSIQLQATTGFNLTFTEQITEVETIATFYTNAVYKLTTTINAPWGAVASRDSLNLESGWGVWLMVGVIVSSGGLFAGAFIFERRLQSKPRKSRK